MGVGTAFPRSSEMGDCRFPRSFSKLPSSILNQKAQGLQTILRSDQGGKCTGSSPNTSSIRENTFSHVSLMPKRRAANSRMWSRSIHMMQSRTAIAAKNNRSRLKNCRWSLK